MQIAAVIPALNERDSVGVVVKNLRDLVDDRGRAVIDQIVVCDNGSTDDTARCAKDAGATVVHEPRAGYGAACLRAIDAVERADVIVFVDADQSVCIDETPLLLTKIAEGFDLAIGVRVPRLREPGSMTWPQLFGNVLACAMIRLIWRVNVRDLGPFRAIRYPVLRQLDMRDRAFGWTVEMQIKAIINGIGVAQPEVSCRRRTGVSKISGTVMGVARAAYGIISTVLLLAVKSGPLPKSLNSRKS